MARIHAHAHVYFASLLITIFALSLNTLGFDVYSHAISLRSFSNAILSGYYYSFPFDIYIHRYVLGYNIFFLGTFSFLPLIPVIASAQAWCATSILLWVLRQPALSSPFLLLLLLYLLVSMSMSNLGVLFLWAALAKYFERKNFSAPLFIGMSLHPLTFFVGLLFIMSPYSKTKVFKIAFSVIMLSAIIGTVSYKLAANLGNPNISFAFVDVEILTSRGRYAILRLLDVLKYVAIPVGLLIIFRRFGFGFMLLKKRFSYGIVGLYLVLLLVFVTASAIDSIRCRPAGLSLVFDARINDAHAADKRALLLGSWISPKHFTGWSTSELREARRNCLEP